VRFGLAVGILAAVVSLLQLFVPRAAGLADNSDYRRLLCHLHVAPDVPAGQPEKFVRVYLTYHHAAVAPPCKFVSPAIGPLWLAAGVSQRLPGHHALDLRVVGVGYALLFGTAIGCLAGALPGPRSWRLLAAAVAVALLGDFAFTSYFASAYSEPLAFVALIAFVGLCLWQWRSGTTGNWPLVATTAVGLVLVMAKPQYGVLAVALAVAVVLRPPREPRPAGVIRARWPAITAGLILLAGGWLAIASSPRDFTKTNQYQVVFWSILPHSRTPAADLEALGLAPKLARWSGTNGYEVPNATSDPAFDGFYDKTGVLSIGKFYATHPGQAFPLIARGLRATADPRVDYLGTTTRTVRGRREPTLCRFCILSATGRLLRPTFPVLLPLFWLAVLAVAVARLRSVRDDERAVARAMLVTLAVSVLGFAAALLGDADFELVKHLYLVDAANALLVVLLVALAGQILTGLREGTLPTAGSPQAPPPVPASTGGPFAWR
jgi:hypothetical protein